MAIRLGSVVINCRDLERMTRFWSAALSLTAPPPGPDDDFRVLGDPRRRVNLSLQRADAPPGTRDQMHLDLYTADQAAEVARLLGLGARHVRDHHDPDDDYVVLADPEGNLLCVCQTDDDEAG